MKRYLKILMTLVALPALLVMTAAPTVAKKPDNPGKPEPGPSGGVTCSRADLDIPWRDPDADVKTDDFQIILDKGSTHRAYAGRGTQSASRWHGRDTRKVY